MFFAIKATAETKVTCNSGNLNFCDSSKGHEKYYRF
jgi:hypothetical protein